MTQIDYSTLINWFVSGVIGLLFGLIIAWVTYRFARKRDDLKWEREKEKLQQQYKQENELLEKKLSQSLKELEQQLQQQHERDLRSEITKGIADPKDTIKQLINLQDKLSKQLPYYPNQNILKAGLSVGEQSLVEIEFNLEQIYQSLIKIYDLYDSNFEQINQFIRSRNKK